MKIETQFLDDHQVKLTVQVEQQPYEEARQRAARQLARKIKIPGFRPGKAPYAVIVRTVGEGAIMEEAMEILVNDVYPKALDEAKIKPYGPGHLENVPSMDPPTFEFVVPLEAEVTLGDYRAIRFPYASPTIADEDVEHTLNDLRERQAVLEPVERAAKEGDRVYLRLKAQLTKPVEGEADLIEERTLPVVILPKNSDKKNEWPFAGFSRKLIGLSGGEEKTFKVTGPEDCALEGLRGKAAQFHVTVQDVKSRNLPELDDQFAQSIGEYETLEALRTEVRSSLENRSQEEYEAGYNDQIMEQLIAESTIKYSPQMREREVDLFMDQLKDRLGSQGMDLDTYMKMRQMNMEALRAEAQPLAEKRLKQTLLLLEIARAEEIEVSPDEIQAESARTLDELSHYLPPEKARKTFTNEFIRGMVGNISADLLIKRTTERLQAIAKGEYPPETPPAEPPAEPGPEAAEQPPAAEAASEPPTPEA